MADDVDKLERERQLDEKIKSVRAANVVALQRKKEVDKDKQLAEINKSSITSVKAKYDYEPYNTPDRGTGKNKLRNRSDDISDPAPRKEAPAKRMGGRLADADGPPPDPGYRFLADRMREEEEEDGIVGRKGREGSHGKTARNNGGAGVDKTSVGDDAELLYLAGQEH